MAHRHGLDFHIEHADVAQLAGNLEQTAREVRREFFRRMIASGVVDRVATGHTLSDQAETVLFRLLRGAGNTGLAGILPLTEDGIVRPLLGVSRDRVLAYLHENALSYRTDHTNLDRSLRRNRIRLDLIPELKRDYNPAVEEQLAQAAELARSEELYWQDEIAALAGQGFRRKAGTVILRGPWLLGHPLAVARRLVRRAIAEVRGDLRQIEFAHVEQVLELAKSAEGHGRRQLPGVDVLRSFEWLRFAPPGLDAGSPRLVAEPLDIPGVARIGSVCVVAQLLQGRNGNCGYNEGEEAEAGFSFLDWDRIEKPLTVRFWLPGDQYRPVGAAGPEKLKQMFQSGRVPLWERRFWPIIENGQGIVWSRRFGPAAGLEASERSGQVLKIGEIVDGE
jgi:tRNA(Ile)-lysidine synthase